MKKLFSLTLLGLSLANGPLYCMEDNSDDSELANLKRQVEKADFSSGNPFGSMPEELATGNKESYLEKRADTMIYEALQDKATKDNKGNNNNDDSTSQIALSERIKKLTLLSQAVPKNIEVPTMQLTTTEKEELQAALLSAIDVISNGKKSKVIINFQQLKKLPICTAHKTHKKAGETNDNLLEQFKTLKKLFLDEKREVTIVRSDQEVDYSDELKSKLIEGLISSAFAIDQQDGKTIINLDKLEKLPGCRTKPILKSTLFQKLTERSTLLVGAGCLGVGYLLATMFGNSGE